MMMRKVQRAITMMVVDEAVVEEVEVEVGGSREFDK